MRRQALNVYKMGLLGAEVVPVDSGSATLKDATNEAIRDWVAQCSRHPLRHRQCRRTAPVPVAGAAPAARHRRRGASADALAARAVCPRWWWPASAAAATPSASSPRSSTTTFAWSVSRPRGAGSTAASTRRHSREGVPGCSTASLSYLMQDAGGQVLATHSISAGLDYPGVGPEHSALRDSGRVEYRRRHRLPTPSPRSTSSACSRASSPRSSRRTRCTSPRRSRVDRARRRRGAGLPQRPR